MADAQHQEPIFELAVECETIFANQITTLSDTGDENAAKIVSDMYQRFASWSAFLGVFAETNVCLDRRLRRHVDIQDQVLLLLDILQRNLACLSEHHDSPRPGLKIMSDEFGSLSQPVRARMQSLEAMSAALDRLNQLGVAIRRSSVTSQVSKAREFADMSDVGSFEQVAYMSLRTLYPDARNTLLEQLTRSMVESYALFSLRKSRKKRLELARPRHDSRSPLHPIREEPMDDCGAPAPSSADPKPSPQVEALRGGVSQAATRTPARLLISQSEPTSLDSQEFKTRIERLLNPSITSKPVSILSNQVGYPRPGKDSLTCDWCFEPLALDSLEGLKWQQHINGDFKPYVCISENCSQALPRFASSTEWFQHMTGDHGMNWHSEVHTPFSWVCPLCIEEDVEFSNPESLSQHLSGCHDDVLTGQQIRAIVRQSIFPSPRPGSSCPLCCFPIVNCQDYLTFEEQGRADRSARERKYIFKPDDGGRKRIRVDANNVQSTDSSISPTDMAIHVAAHLQSVMFFTMRLISIEGDLYDTAGSQSSATDTDDKSSWAGSGPRDLDQDMPDSPQEDFSKDDDHQMDFEYGSSPAEIVSESEYIDWHHVPRRHEDVTIDRDGEPSSDEYVSKAESAVNTSDIKLPIMLIQHGENDDQTWERLAFRREFMYTLAESEHNWASYLKRTSSRDIPELPSDLSFRFRRAEHLALFAEDFAKDLRQAALLPSQLRSSATVVYRQPRAPSGSLASALRSDGATDVGKAFMARTQELEKIYVQYLQNQTATTHCLQDIRDWLSERSRSVPGEMSFDDIEKFLGKPMKRLLKYPDLLNRLLDLTPKGHPDWLKLFAANVKAARIISLVELAIKRQEVVNRVLKSPPPPKWRKLNDTWNSDRENPITQFFTKRSAIIRLVSDMTVCMEATHRAVITLGDVSSAGKELFTEPSNDNQPRTSKWSGLRRAVEHAIVQVTDNYLNPVTETIVRRLNEVLLLWDRPALLMAHRAYRKLSAYTKELPAHERALRDPEEKQQEEYVALEETLEYELPHLYSLTATVMEECLHRFAKLQEYVFKEMHYNLQQLGIEAPAGLEAIASDWGREKELREAGMLSLTTCNGGASFPKPSIPPTSTVYEHIETSTEEML